MADLMVQAISEADEMYENNKLTEAHSLLLMYKDSNNAEILWRLARVSRRLAQLPIKNQEERKSFIYDGLEFAERSVEVNPSNGQSYKWHGIMLTAMSDFIGIQKKIENAYVIRDLFLKAIEFCPDDAISHHSMGKWCYLCADMPIYQRKIAELFFTSPPKSTYEEALKYFKDAENLSPDFYCSNLLMIGKCCIALKRKEEAKYWLERTFQFAAKSEDDKEAVLEAQALLAEERR